MVRAFPGDDSEGSGCSLDLPSTLGKMSPWVNVRRLKFFEERDADFAGPDDGLVLPLIIPVAGAHDPRYEVDKILWNSGFVVRCRRRMCPHWFLLTMRILVSLSLGSRCRNGRRKVRPFCYNLLHVALVVPPEIHSSTVNV